MSRKAFADATQDLRDNGWTEGYRIGNFNHYWRNRNSQQQEIVHSVEYREWVFRINNAEMMHGTLTQCVKAAEDYTAEMDRFLIANQEVPD